MLASEYGWSRDDILGKISLDEVLRLQKCMQKRKIADYRILAIVTHSDPEKLISELEAQLYDPMENAKLDKGGLEELKGLMAMGSKFVVK